MKKLKKILATSLSCIIMCVHLIAVQAAEITCTVEINGQNVSISGQIPNATKPNQVTLLVGSAENIMYINQTTSQANGAFNFNFPLGDNVEYGNYNFKIGSNSGLAPYEGILEYTEPTVTARNKFIEADVDIQISAYTPTVTGTVYCTEGKTILLNIVNKSDNAIIANETITSENGIFNLSYTLPNLVSPKEYEVTLSCTEGNNNLANMSVTIDSAILSVDITGTVSTASNVDVDAQLTSVNTSLIDKSTNFTGSREVSATIPNLLASAAFHLTAQGYETVEITSSEPEEEYSIHTLNLDTDEETVVMMTGENISAIEGKTFEIIYDSQKVKPIKFYGLYPTNILGIGQHNNINILSHESGRMVFEISNMPIPSGKYQNGIVNIFKFKNISDTTVNTDIQIKPLG